MKLTDQLVSACKHIHNLGYKIALDDHDFDPKWDVLLPYIDIVKVDIADVDMALVEQNLHKFKAAKVKLVAERVETAEEFEQCKALGFGLFPRILLCSPRSDEAKEYPFIKNDFAGSNANQFQC